MANQNQTNFNSQSVMKITWNSQYLQYQCESIIKNN